jgi:hypothetical protein
MWGRGEERLLDGLTLVSAPQRCRFIVYSALERKKVRDPSVGLQRLVFGSQARNRLAIDAVFHSGIQARES